MYFDTKNFALEIQSSQQKPYDWVEAFVVAVKISCESMACLKAKKKNVSFLNENKTIAVHNSVRLTILFLSQSIIDRIGCYFRK